MSSKPFEIAKAICTFIEGLNLRVTPIITPNNDPTPAGKYIAVRVNGIRQVCGLEKPKPKQPNENVQGNTRFEMEAQIIISEMDGDGETLSTILENMQLDTFKAIEDANDFAVWDISDVMNNDLQDGDEWIYSKMFTASINYTDEVRHSAERIAEVAGTINDKEFDFELEENEE